ncbi:hypothetical protein TBS_27080 [Thermobispora bispora]|uniref:YcaO domain-containing protein n=1 Tax=Thermobispora bispora (strain ATCC 19993 / DSM 43833 / CBS 139.67 / JCM 10125 / KCTC 9307 / NBRC 14880 / R51) TaxID=469371 RepID=D6Y506_THEBD|nr:YcaO-like family protein [Thermobispora bispora]ADG87281.1 protein of unknown function DUF181 [Thermobispora bispora DSM 43833]MBO2475148.1 hypothetical protein [Actinomycetales bacterium]
MIPARPVLTPGVRYAPTSDGVAFLTRDGIVSITGVSIHRWIDRIAPHLTGERSVAELTDGLAPERRAFVLRLLQALADRGLIIDAAGGREPRLERGTACALHVTETCGPYRESLPKLARSLADALTRAGLDVRLASASEPCDPERCHALVHLTAADEVGLAAAERLDRLSERWGVPIAHVVVWGGEIWRTEAGTVGEDGLPLAAGWRRLTALRPDTEERVPISPTAAVVVAGQVAADVRDRLTTATRAGRRPRLHVVEPARLTCRAHHFIPHFHTMPLTGDAPLAEELTEEEFSRRAAALMDDRTGVFTEIAEGDFGQLPLHVAVTTVADPVGLLGPAGDRPRVIGVGPDFATARYRTARAAIALYGLLAVDPRRLVDADGEPLAGPRTSAAELEDLLGRIRAGGLPAFVRAEDVRGGPPRLLPASSVFPFATARALLAGTVPTGTAVGYSEEGALRAALLDHCRERTLADLASRRVARLTPDTAPSDPVTARYLAFLRAIGLPFDVLDATGPLGVPVYVGVLDGRVVAAEAGASPGEAFRSVLEGILRGLQGIPAARSLPDTLPPVLPEAMAVPDGSPLSAEALAAALARAGLSVSVVRLDHDRRVHALIPHCVRVMVTGEESAHV